MVARTQQERAEVTNTPPPSGALLPGQLYLELADPMRIWAGVSTSLAASQAKLIFDAAVASQALNKTGDTATGLITFSAGLTSSGPTTVPQATVDSNNNLAASTAYVQGQASATLPLMDGTAAIGVSSRWARGDHVHPSDTTRAPLISPVFTGTPTVPAPPVDDNTLKIANTQWFMGQASSVAPSMDGYASVGVSTRWARADHVHPTDTTRAVITISDNPPAAPQPGNLWWSSADAQLYIYYNDPNSTQWVVAVNQNGGVSEAPTDGQIYGRGNSTWTPVLPLAGGTVTGGLAVNGQIYASGGYVQIGTSGEFYLQDDVTDGVRVLAWFGQQGWYDAWRVSDGFRMWVGSSGNLMTLDANGNLAAMGSIYGGRSVYIDYPTVTDFWLGRNPSIQVRYFNWANNWYDQWNEANGTRSWLGNGVLLMTLDGNGNLTTNASISAFNGAMQMGVGSSSYFLQMASGWYWNWNSADGTLQWIGAMHGGQWAMRQTPDTLCWNALGSVAGYGAYQDLSDARTKHDVTPASVGLREILALNPIHFTRNPPGDPSASGLKHLFPPDIGFDADELHAIMPEAVRPIGITLPDGSGGIDSDRPTLGILTTPIVAALVNATKELDRRLTAVEARR